MMKNHSFEKIALFCKFSNFFPIFCELVPNSSIFYPEHSKFLHS